MNGGKIKKMIKNRFAIAYICVLIRPRDRHLTLVNNEINLIATYQIQMSLRYFFLSNIRFMAIFWHLAAFP